ncbi:MAG TPA: adenylate/guanylate cyclase domain-containing protein, partial [Caldilineaceae bacterium]|nr:adenylate/guanylate cyclase domain-containing protein [Caldilineaceae bacterium]
MNPTEVYIPIDRRLALARGVSMSEECRGAVLFVDISGFTPLTGALTRYYGPRRGVEELTRLLNRVYTDLIAEIDNYQGSVIGFSGDAVTCWFDAQDQQLEDATMRGLSAALAVQRTMTKYRPLHIAPKGNLPPDPTQEISLAVKTVIAVGNVRRFTVGDPQIQLIDVLAGTTLDRVAATETMARQNELLSDEESLRPFLAKVVVDEWRTDTKTGRRYARIRALNAVPQPTPWPACPPLSPANAQPWVLPAIAERLWGEQSRFLAELRPAAALFLRFTGLDFDHDPESPQKLDRYIQWVQRIVDQHEGALIQLTTGDKGSYLYASFGAPLAHDDDIGRAVAVAMVLRTTPPTCPFIRSTQIGITYGMMRVGAYGGETRKTYGVLGTETNMAARLMVHAAPGQVVVSKVVAETLGADYELVSLGTHQLKGTAEAKALYAVQRLRLNAVGQPRLYETPLVGRDAELAQLRSGAQECLAKRGGLVRIEGSAGLGKSHLAAAFAQEVEPLGLRSIVASGQSTTQGTAYFAIRQCMQKLLNLDLDAFGNSSEAIDALDDRIQRANPAWTLRIPLLGDLLGLPIHDNATTSAFDARLRQEALTTLTVEIIQHFAASEQLLLLFEDIHWLDEASQGIVLALGRAISTTPVMLLLVHRPPTRDNESFFREVVALPEQNHILLQ